MPGSAKRRLFTNGPVPGSATAVTTPSTPATNVSKAAEAPSGAGNQIQSPTRVNTFQLHQMKDGRQVSDGEMICWSFYHLY